MLRNRNRVRVNIPRIRTCGISLRGICHISFFFPFSFYVSRCLSHAIWRRLYQVTSFLPLPRVRFSRECRQFFRNRFISPSTLFFLLLFSLLPSRTAYLILLSLSLHLGAFSPRNIPHSSSSLCLFLSSLTYLRRSKCLPPIASPDSRSQTAEVSDNLRAERVCKQVGPPPGRVGSGLRVVRDSQRVFESADRPRGAIRSARDHAGDHALGRHFPRRHVITAGRRGSGRVGEAGGEGGRGRGERGRGRGEGRQGEGGRDPGERGW